MKQSLVFILILVLGGLVSSLVVAGSFAGWAPYCNVDAECPEYHTCEVFDHHCVDGTLHGTYDCDCGKWNDYFSPSDLVCNCLDCKMHNNVPVQNKKLCLYEPIKCTDRQDCPDMKYWDCSAFSHNCFVIPFSFRCEGNGDCPEDWYCLKTIPPSCEDLLPEACVDGKPSCCATVICGNGLCLPRGWLGFGGGHSCGIYSTVDFTQDGYPEYQTVDGYSLLLGEDAVERDVLIRADEDLRFVDGARGVDTPDRRDNAMLRDTHISPDAGGEEPNRRTSSCSVQAAPISDSNVSANIGLFLMALFFCLSRRRAAGRR
jgi:hypothetical protein